jgi:predicted secreted hydrolase
VGLDAIDSRDCSASPERCDVKMGSSYLRQENGLYKMSMHARNIGCELTYKGILPGWKSGDGNFPGGALSRGWAGWVIPCPRAKVEGNLFIKGEEIKVTGEGYHDHNWGDIDLYDLFKGWYWGRLNDSRYTIIFSCTTTLKDIMEPYLLIADKKGTILSTNKYEFAVEQEEIDPATGRKYAKIINLKYKGQDVALQCRLNTKHVVEHSALPKVNEYDMFNWRFLADYEGQIVVDGKAENIKGETIHERLLFRP